MASTDDPNSGDVTAATLHLGDSASLATPRGHYYGEEIRVTPAALDDAPGCRPSRPSLSCSPP